MMTRSEAAAWLAAHDNFCLLSHRRPDGDTIGSTAALCRGLRLAGKEAVILRNPETTPRFAWLHQGLTVEKPEENMTLVTVDVASPGMLGSAFKAYQEKVALRIDHHASATSFTPYEIVDGDSASCAELVWDILECMGLEMDKNVAEAVYVGMSTDTGCFRFGNTNAHSFATAAKCAQAGARIYDLNQELFETNTLERLKIQGWIVEHLKRLRGGEMALCVIPNAVEKEIGVTEDDMDNISNFPRTVAGVRVACMLREEEDGTVKLSVRAVPGFDGSRIAVKFGGGGHAGAAGASIRMNLQEAAQAVEQAMLELA